MGKSSENNEVDFNEKIQQEKILGKRKRIEILGAKVDVLTFSETLDLVEQYIIKKEPLHLIGVNASKINESIENRKMMEIVNSCGVINADGESAVWASKKLKTPLPERVSGIDLMLSLTGLCAKKKYSVYLLGAKREVVEKTKDILSSKHKNLIIKGFRDGYFKDNEWDDISGELKKLKPDVVFVGITSPKKEYLIEHLQNSGIKSVFMGVGGSFDVISGYIPRAPKWMQNHGLEWLFRFIQEPRRLFKRYFLGNIKFMREVGKYARSKKKNK